MLPARLATCPRQAQPSGSSPSLGPVSPARSWKGGDMRLGTLLLIIIIVLLVLFLLRGRRL